ncbi:hypothetical protein PAPHI01_0994 [Pancytospora philotis]|nr:hypothetical protein PAPHI01_0994 [Pancytospora philotis]
MDRGGRPLLDGVRTENGAKVLDLEESMEAQELLSELFYKPTAAVGREAAGMECRSDSRRYFDSRAKCTRCGEKGHVSQECMLSPTRACCFCAQNHKNGSCRYALCLQCGNLGHREKQCQEKRPARHLCIRCLSRPHFNLECPLRWQRYRIEHCDVLPGFRMCCAYCHSTAHMIDDCEMKAVKLSIFTKSYLSLLAQFSTQETVQAPAPEPAKKRGKKSKKEPAPEPAQEPPKKHAKKRGKKSKKKQAPEPEKKSSTKKS